MNCPNCGEKWHGCECTAEEMVDAARKQGRIAGLKEAVGIVLKHRYDEAGYGYEETKEYNRAVEEIQQAIEAKIGEGK